jgi:hypothetical protein
MIDTNPVLSVPEEHLTFLPVGGYQRGQIARGGFLVLSALISFGRRRDMDSCLFSSFIPASLTGAALLGVFSSSLTWIGVGGVGGVFSCKCSH